MDIEDSIDAKCLIDNVFKNVLLIAVTHKLDLSEIVTFVENILGNTDEAIDVKFQGLLFFELLAKEMGISVADLLSDDEEHLKNLVNQIITTLSMEGVVIDIDNAESLDEESYIMYEVTNLKVFDKTAKFVYTGDVLDEELDTDPVHNDYLIELVKSGKEYSMSILVNNVTNSDLFRNQLEVWREEQGLLAEFVEEALEENLSISFKEGVSKEELVAWVSEDTRTIRLLDKFEGFGAEEEPSYHRMVIKNGLIYLSYGSPYIHLVMERRSDNNVTGDITMTRFKMGEISELRQHIIEELDESIIEGFCDKNQFYRFKKGYLLRAQNSKNRSGYGWVWNWKNGVGTYIKGTEYGETTDYVFVGAYISKAYIFDASKREEMMQWIYSDEKVYDNEHSNKSDTEEVQEDVDCDDASDFETVFEEINKVVAPVPIHIYDVEKLKKDGDNTQIIVGSHVKYKKIHANEECEVVIDCEKLLHKKFLGKIQGDLILDGKKQYLIVKVEN